MVCSSSHPVRMRVRLAVKCAVVLVAVVTVMGRLAWAIARLPLQFGGHNSLWVMTCGAGAWALKFAALSFNCARLTIWMRSIEPSSMPSGNAYGAVAGPAIDRKHMIGRVCPNGRTICIPRYAPAYPRLALGQIVSCVHRPAVSSAGESPQFPPSDLSVRTSRRRPAT